MRTRISDNKEQIFCEWRHKWVRLTPEERVRQQLLHHMVEQYGYPKALIGVEVPIKVGAGIEKRCDAVVYTNSLQPQILIEFKAEQVTITGEVLDQAAVYNTAVHAPYLILTNGKQIVVAHISPDNQITFLNRIPEWRQL